MICVKNLKGGSKRGRGSEKYETFYAVLIPPPTPWCPGLEQVWTIFLLRLFQILYYMLNMFHFFFSFDFESLPNAKYVSYTSFVLNLIMVSKNKIISNFHFLLLLLMCFYIHFNNSNSLVCTTPDKHIMGNKKRNTACWIKVERFSWKSKKIVLKI